MAITVGMVSLGCSKNRVDSEQILGMLKENGFEITNDEAQAEVIIVNTCGFINPAKEESIGAILEMAQHKKGGNCVCVPPDTAEQIIRKFYGITAPEETKQRALGLAINLADFL